MRTFLARLVVLPYDQRVAARWGELQAYAQVRGRPRPANDTSRNVRDVGGGRHVAAVQDADGNARFLLQEET